MPVNGGEGGRSHAGLVSGAAWSGVVQVAGPTGSVVAWNRVALLGGVCPVNNPRPKTSRGGAGGQG